MSHQKHAKIARPAYGQFHRNEWAIIGTPCGKIQQLAYELIQELRDTYRIAYVDADHKHGDEHEQLPENPANAMEAGASFEYTDKINFHRFDSNAAFDSYQHRVQFNNEDLVLVNGNHFKAKHQIVVLDPKKKESLSRKLDRLTDVQLILTTDQGEEPYDFLEEKLAGRSVPVFILKKCIALPCFWPRPCRKGGLY
jgi:molybdopterin-guanine dinucleotide biosynthesis protein A